MNKTGISYLQGTYRPLNFYTLFPQFSSLSLIKQMSPQVIVSWARTLILTCLTGAVAGLPQRAECCLLLAHPTWLIHLALPEGLELWWAQLWPYVPPKDSLGTGNIGWISWSKCPGETKGEWRSFFSSYVYLFLIQWDRKWGSVFKTQTGMELKSLNNREKRKERERKGDRHTLGAVRARLR